MSGRVLPLVAIVVSSLAACARDDSRGAAAGPPVIDGAASTSGTTTTTTPTTTSTNAPTSTGTSARPSTSVALPAAGPATSASTEVPGAGLAADPVASRIAFDTLSAGSSAASITVLTDGVPVMRLASGRTNGGAPVTTDTPMVVASVSKLVTALTVARLVEQGVVTADEVVPWDAMGFAHDPAWNTVTIRDLLDHTSGIPIERKAWLDDPGSCAVPLGDVLGRPPMPERGTWVYSNGNYCALGLFVEHVTGERFDAAAYRLVLSPLGITGPHLTIDGGQPGDAPYARGVGRFDRLGGAGQWIASTDDIATVLASITDADRRVLTWPGVFIDQYGWGHTGSVDGAGSCAWVVEGGRTVVVVTVSGAQAPSGGGVCDLMVPAVVADRGLTVLGKPVRSPD